MFKWRTKKNNNTYLEQALSASVLNHAWKKISSDNARWSRRITMIDMKKDFIFHLLELRESLLTERYRAESMRCFEINKADGKKRMLSASVVRDKLAQRAILTVIEPLGEKIFNDNSFGYRPNCTIDMAMAKLREYVRKGNIWLVDADIENCFDNIRHKPVLKEVQMLCHDEQITALIQQWLNAMPTRFRKMGGTRGLPQGMVISPFLCNLYLHQLDQVLEQNNIPFVRYADDFVLLSVSEKQAKRNLKLCTKQLKKLGLILHPEKTQIIKTNSKYQFLGKRLPNCKQKHDDIFTMLRKKS